jgi:hypothetical protein
VLELRRNRLRTIALAFPADDVARMLGTTAAAVKSAL